MKVAVLSESAADEAAVEVLVGSLLGAAIERVAGPPLRSRGWPSVVDILPTVVKHLYYRTDADGLVVVVDGNHSSIHTASHEQLSAGQPDCRMCHLRGVIATVQRSLRPVPTRGSFRIAVGVATPAIEAWYRAGLDPHVGEVVFGRSNARESFATKVRLKREVYGTDRPSLDLEKRRATEEANRLVGNVEVLETSFPGGFGQLATSIRGWRR